MKNIQGTLICVGWRFISQAKGEIELPESEKTGLIWADTMEGDWEKNWQSSHNVVATPDNRTSMMKIHSWFANAWVTRRETTTKRLGKGLEEGCGLHLHSQIT